MDKNKKFTTTERHIEMIAQAVVRIEEQVKTLRTDMNAHFDKVDERFAKMNERFDRVDERLDTTNERLESLETTTGRHYKDIADLQNRTRLLETQMGKLEVAR